MHSIVRAILVVYCFVAIFAVGADAPPAKLKYGAWGFDLSGAYISAKAGDNFLRYANGAWIDRTSIPPDKPAYSLRLAMTDLTEQRLTDMLEASGTQAADNPTTLEEKASAFYR